MCHVQQCLYVCVAMCVSQCSTVWECECMRVLLCIFTYVCVAVCVYLCECVAVCADLLPSLPSALPCWLGALRQQLLESLEAGPAMGGGGACLQCCGFGVTPGRHGE